MTKFLYVVRHCKAEGQTPEAPLTAEGREQAHALAHFLVEAVSRDGVSIERIISSPFARAQESIAPLASHLRLPVEIDSRLGERVLTTVARADWLDQFRASFDDLDLCFEGGESSNVAMERAIAVIAEIRQHPAKATVAVSHGNLITLLRRHFDGYSGFEEWRQLTNPDVFRVRLDPHATLVERIWPASA